MALTKDQKQALKFTLFSISAGIIQILSYTLLLEVLKLDAWLAYLVSLILSVVWNFTFNRKYTFYAAADIKKAMLLTLIYYLVFTPVSTLWTAMLTGTNPFVTDEPTCAQGVKYAVEIGTMLINFITEFLWQKFVVYKDGNKK